MKSKIEELLLSKDSNNHNLAFAIISGDDELTEKYSNVFAEEMLKTNNDWHDVITYRYSFIQNVGYYLMATNRLTFFSFENTKLKLKQSMFGSIKFDTEFIEEPKDINKESNGYCVYDNNKFCTTTYYKQELIEILKTWFVKFFKDYTKTPEQ